MGGSYSEKASKFRFNYISEANPDLKLFTSLLSPHMQTCKPCYVGETTQHFSTRVREHLVTDKASYIFKHLQNSEHCRALCSVDCFHILDHASTGFQLKIKETFHIQRQQPSLNQQLHHVNLKLSF